MSYLNLVSERADVVTYAMNTIDGVSVRKADKITAVMMPQDAGRYEIRPGDELIIVRFLDDSEERFRADKWSIYFSEEYPPFKG